VVGYRDGEGTVSQKLPTCAADWNELKAEVKYFPGWQKPTRGATRLEQLPPEARAYLEALVESVETPIAYLSTGPDREEGLLYTPSFLEGML